MKKIHIIVHEQKRTSKINRKYQNIKKGRKERFFKSTLDLSNFTKTVADKDSSTGTNKIVVTNPDLKT